MSEWEYHVAIWQSTVAPDDPHSAAPHLEIWLNGIARSGWEIFQVDTHQLVNNIFRVVVIGRRSAALAKAQAAEVHHDVLGEPEEDQSERPAPRKRHR